MADDFVFHELSKIAAAVEVWCKARSIHYSDFFLLNIASEYVEEWKKKYISLYSFLDENYEDILTRANHVHDNLEELCYRIARNRMAYDQKTPVKDSIKHYEDTREDTTDEPAGAE